MCFVPEVFIFANSVDTDDSISYASSLFANESSRFDNVRYPLTGFNPFSTKVWKVNYICSEFTSLEFHFAFL